MNNQIVTVQKLVKSLQFSLLSIFSSLFPHGLPLLVLLSLRIHYASLHICRFLCEVACLSVKWTMCTHSKHVIMCTRTVLSRTWLKVPSSTDGEISTHSSAGPSSDTTRSDSTQPSSFLCASSSLPSQVWYGQSMNFSDHSLSVLFCFTVSHLPVGLSASLSEYHVFCTYIIPH